jgi:hypothetical protein
MVDIFKWWGGWKIRWETEGEDGRGGKDDGSEDR